MKKSRVGASIEDIGFHSRFLWRVSGFPYELIEQFSLPVLAEQCLLQNEQLINSGHSTENIDGSILSAHSNFESFEFEFQRLRKLLKTTLQDDRILSAISSSSPKSAQVLKLFSNSAIGERKSKEKRRELLAIRYLQRFATKCETNAFFGPVALGEIENITKKINVMFNPNSYQESIFIGDRLLYKLIDWLRRQPEFLNNCNIRTSSGVHISKNDDVTHSLYGDFRLNLVEHKILHAAIAGIKVSRFVADYLEHQNIITQSIHMLLKKKLLFDDLSSIQHCNNPLKQLKILARNSNVAAEFIEFLDFLEKCQLDWPLLSFEKKMARISKLNRYTDSLSIELVINKNSFYRDHMHLVEDGFCSETRIQLNTAWTKPYLEKIAKILEESIAKTNNETLLAIQKSINIHNSDKFTIPLTEFIRNIFSNKITTSPECSTPNLEYNGPLLSSPDLMIAASSLQSIEENKCEWIITETHSCISAISFFTRVIPYRVKWIESATAFIANKLKGNEIVCLNYQFRNKTSHTAYIDNFSHIEVDAPCPSNENRISISDIDVSFKKGLLPTLQNRLSRKNIILLPPNRWELSGVFSLFSVPSCFKKYQHSSARIYKNGILVKRASWNLIGCNVPPSDSSSYQIFFWAQVFRKNHQLPRWIFIKPQSEQKSMYIDFCCPFLCEELARLLRIHNQIQVEEMHPSPENIWLRGDDGHYFSEFRLLFASRLKRVVRP